MIEFERIVSSIERELDLERCLTALPTLLELSEGEKLAQVRAYVLAARCGYLAGEVTKYEEMLRLAKECATSGPIEGEVRIALLEASLLTAAGKFSESDEKLSFALEHHLHISDEVKGLSLSILGRNQTSRAEYVEAIDNSHEAIALSPPLSSAAAFAHGTIAMIFQSMGRSNEAEQYALEQLRIMSERGGTKWIPAIYTFLSRAAADAKDYVKAQNYAQQADELSAQSGIPATSQTLSLLWLSSSRLELEQLEEALTLATQAYESAKVEQNLPAQANACLIAGEILYKLRKCDLALGSLLEAFNQKELLGDSQRLYLYRWLAATYKALDRKAEAFDICYELWELQADFDNRTREALLRYHKALEEKLYAQKTAMLNMRTAQMERELAMSATQLVAQVDLLGRFRNDLREIVRQSRSDDPALKQVKDKLKELPCEQIDWVNFDAQFSSVHPEFKSKLTEKHPDLTRSETKICALSRMKLTSEEIGRLLCLSDRTVQTHRLNIRKKLGLRTEQNLGTYLASL